MKTPAKKLQRPVTDAQREALFFAVLESFAALLEGLERSRRALDLLLLAALMAQREDK